MKPVHQFASMLKVVGLVLALIGLLPAVPGVVQADVEPAPAGLFAVGAHHTCALKPSGAVDCWGFDYNGQVSGTPENDSHVATHPGPYIGVFAGLSHTCALTPVGALECWGQNGFGEGTNMDGPYTQVGAGVFHNCALEPLGAVDCWGYSNSGMTNDQPGPYTQVSVNHARSCAVTAGGAVDCWGENLFGEADDQVGPYIQVSAGSWYTCAVALSGAVDCWGFNDYGQVTGTYTPEYTHQFATHPGPYIQVSASHYYTCALEPNGAVDCWSRGNSDQETDKPGPYTRIETSYAHTCGLTPAGVLECWGVNCHGEAQTWAGPYGPYNPNPNATPVANPGGPYLGAINTAISFDGSGSSDPDGDPLTYAWAFGDGGTSTEATPTHGYAAAGVYDVCLTVHDGTVDSPEACTLAVVYDPSAGFVTGGGWIDSPAGAYEPDPALAGQATFGFVSKYHKGATVPTGNTEFQFDVAGFSFDSETYEWLVVNQGGTNAQFKGSGTVNGGLDPNGNAYKFMLWAGDGSPDTFRIRIWWEDAAGEHEVYDNGTDQPMSAGNIVIHTK